MNRDARNRLKRASSAFHCSVMHAVTGYRSEVELLKADEEDKLDRLPDSIRDSAKGEAISDAMEMLDDVLEGTDRIEEELENIIRDTLGYAFAYESVTELRTETPAGLKRDMRFQALLPNELATRLRFRSSVTGLSMNELLIRALDSVL